MLVSFDLIISYFQALVFLQLSSTYVCMRVCMHVHMLVMHNAHLKICAWLGETNNGGVEFSRCPRSAKVFGYDRGPILCYPITSALGVHE
jgi:hypothetical protein